MDPSRNTPFRPVELGIKKPVHVTDRGPPDVKPLEKIYRGLGQRGLIHPQPHYPSLPCTSNVVEISQNKFGWRTGFYGVDYLRTKDHRLRFAADLLVFWLAIGG